MACPNRLCRNVILSDSVTFEDPNLLINIPAGSYNNGQRYCLVIAQDIPVDTTIAASVGITIGDDTDTIYPLVNCDCTNASACDISSRSVYPCVVRTNIQSGVFKLLDNIGCCNRCGSFNAAPSIPIPVTAEAASTTTGGEG